MATQAPRRVAVQTGRDRSSGAHDGFMRHQNFRWLKIAVALSFAFLLAYILIDVQPRHNGGSWYGYILGTVGAGLILWLTMLGVRKRAMTAKRWSLKSWTSAHVYLGLSLIVIGTLHTGFQFGMNVHTLSYVLMMFVIISGIFGVIGYSTLPQAMSNNRAEMTEACARLTGNCTMRHSPCHRRRPSWCGNRLIRIRSVVASFGACLASIRTAPRAMRNLKFVAKRLTSPISIMILWKRSMSC
jgi:hypothetical protein